MIATVTWYIRLAEVEDAVASEQVMKNEYDDSSSSFPQIQR